ncbi:glutaminyl-peptide cyclotransferase isoform X1 [Nasonia vitripennis]|uniref:Glutaminyl-peptide cyclotransferase n=2 Tax=Nasonia vitripennis TaxID=7425 RepID=A0A7M7LJE1_NASVI|nr:glutaminyl-peptide cyclotransferase isoform X1 [Nasonia vitripennis]
MLLTSGSGVRRSAAIFLLPILAACCSSAQQQQQQRVVPFRKAKLMHKPSYLSQAQLNTLASLSNVDHMNEVLDNVCIPRVVGTPGHKQVREYITSSMKNLNWTVENDKFEDYTPIFGRIKFENIIAKYNPNAKRYLTLACHYDSKYEQKYDFIGATDSAVPCMQLINLAKVMEKQLKSIKEHDVSLMLLFLDGEEAFKQWGPKDSIYGARHLAAKWHKNQYTYGTENGISDLDKIDLFVLLDLIGAPNPTFYNYFSDTSKWYSLMSKAESILAEMRQFEKYSYGRPQRKYFQDYTITAGIQDDHLPFLEKNVPILHLIPYPFPDFWHTEGDNRNAIDLATVENLNKILRVFVASYLNMQVQEENVQSTERSEL